MTEALAPVSRTACATVSNTGVPSNTVPPLPGVTPATTLVPYSFAPLVWNAPVLPEMPWTSRRVFLSTRTLIRFAPERERPHGPRRLTLDIRSLAPLVRSFALLHD